MARFAWRRFISPQDCVWILLFAVIIMLGPGSDTSLDVLLAAMALVQISEPKLDFTSTTRGKVISIGVKLVIGYLIIGYTGGLVSSYYLILLLPVVSAATSLGVLATLWFSLVASGAYLSFLLFVDWSRYSIPPDQVGELVLRTVFLAMAGNLANTLAEAVREQSGNYRKVAEQLAAANKDLREAEDAVRRSDRLAALGQLSAGIAHELRNPLGTIKASAEMLSRSVAEENDVAREVAGFISSEVDRTNSLVTRFLDFARPLKLRSEPADLAQTLDRAIEMAQRDNTARQVSFYRNYSPDIAPFPFDSELMERVFYNLLLNAAQATAAGGAVTAKTRKVDGRAEIAIIDRGTGIEAKLLDTIFNPFVTTKPSGVGLGLAIVSKIVDVHGGKITVESEPGKGSVFRVYLPLAGVPAERKA